MVTNDRDLDQITVAGENLIRVSLRFRKLFLTSFFQRDFIVMETGYLQAKSLQRSPTVGFDYGEDFMETFTLI